MIFIIKIQDLDETDSRSFYRIENNKLFDYIYKKYERVKNYVFEHKENFFS